MTTQVTEERTGALEYIRFQSEDGTYIIAMLDDGLTIVGNMLDPQIGMTYRLQGRIKQHPRFGPQFEFTSYQTTLPASTDSIKYYLINNAKWIGPELARQIANKYKAETLNILKADPERVASEIKGLSLKHAQEIQGMLLANEKNEHILLELKDLIGDIRVPKNCITQMMKLYRDNAAAVVRKRPYTLIEDIDGIGFPTADSIALKVGYARDGEPRIRAGLKHTLKLSEREGHVCLPVRQLSMNCEKLLHVDRHKINEVVNSMLREDDSQIVEDNDFIYSKRAWEDELYITEKVKRMVGK